MGKVARSIDVYIAALPPETRKVLKELRAVIRSAGQRATQTICDGIPTFELGGQYLVYFAGWKKHIGS